MKSKALLGNTLETYIPRGGEKKKPLKNLEEMDDFQGTCGLPQSDQVCTNNVSSSLRSSALKSRDGNEIDLPSERSSPGLERERAQA